MATSAFSDAWRGFKNEGWPGTALPWATGTSGMPSPAARRVPNGTANENVRADPLGAPLHGLARD